MFRQNPYNRYISNSQLIQLKPDLLQHKTEPPKQPELFKEKTEPHKEQPSLLFNKQLDQTTLIQQNEPLVNKQPEKIIEKVIEKLPEMTKFADRDELFTYLNTKFSKLDDALVAFRQEKKPSIESIITPTNTPNEKIENLLVNNQLNEKRKKKTYANVDDTMFLKLKEKYPNFPEDKKPDVVLDNDGNFYISKNRKKYILNNVNAMKIINNK